MNIRSCILYVFLIIILINVFACKNSDAIDLTPVEEAWLNQHQNNIDILFSDGAPPNMFQNDMNEYVGIFPDYSYTIAELIGIDFKTKSFKTKGDLLDYSENNNNFIIVGIAHTLNRSNYLSFSSDIINVPYVIVVRNKSEINSMEDLKDKIVCTVKDSAVNDFIREKYPAISPIPVHENLEGLRRVSTGIYDAVIISQMYASYIIEQQGITNLRIADDSGYLNSLRAAVSTKDPILSSIVNKAVKKIDQRTRKKIYHKWVNIGVKTDYNLNITMIVVITIISLIALSIILIWVVRLRKQLLMRTDEISQSKSRYKNYLDNAPVGVFLLDRKGIFLELNDAAENMAGYSRDELLGKNVSDIFESEQTKKIKEKLLSLSQGDHTVLTVSFVQKIGITTYWTINATTESKNGILCFAIDISENIEREKVIENNSLELIKQYRKSEEQRLSNLKILSKLNETTKSLKQEINDRKNIETALIKSEETFRKLVENLGEGICLIDRKGIFRFVNPMMQDIFETDKNLVKRSIFDFIQENEHTSFAFNSIFNKTDQIRRFNLNIIAENGEKKILNVVSSYHSSVDFSENTNLYIFSDITKMIEEQDAMIHSSKMDAIGQLAGGIAHDFNNMLTGIIGSAQVLNQLLKEEDSDSITFVDLITQTAERAADLTSKLLAFSRKGTIERTVINLENVLNDTKMILSRSLDKKTRISMKLNADCYFVNGDYTQLQNVFMNLGINSSHAMPDGGLITFSIENVDLSMEFCKDSIFEIVPGKFLKICVKDTGIGIDEKNINRIFEPFFTTKEKNKGTGLGLAAVYGTVQEHDGAITVDSELNEGTEICIYLPVAERSVDLNEEDESIVIGEGGILVIDDEEVILTTVRMMLEDLGYDVFDSGSAVEALNIYKLMKSQIDLIILDLIMPEMSGAEVFQEIKKINPNAKVLLTSGYTEKNDSDTLLRQKVDGFLTKPYKKEKLSRVIAEILKK